MERKAASAAAEPVTDALLRAAAADLAEEARRPAARLTALEEELEEIRRARRRRQPPAAKRAACSCRGGGCRCKAKKTASKAEILLGAVCAGLTPGQCERRMREVLSAGEKRLREQGRRAFGESGTLGGLRD
jgi:hypothetical protein